MEKINYNGGIYEGNLKNGIPHGKGILTHEYGDIYKGQWVNGKRDGLGIQIIGDGFGGIFSKVAGLFKDDECISPDFVDYDELPELVDSNSKQNDTEFKFKKQVFNSFQLSLFFSAFGLKLFARPQANDIFVYNNPNGSCSFYFNALYYEKLRKDMEDSLSSGKFSESNSERDWSNLLYSLSQAVNVVTDDELPVEDYYNTMRKYWGL